MAADQYRGGALSASTVKWYESRSLSNSAPRLLFLSGRDAFTAGRHTDSGCHAPCDVIKQKVTGRDALVPLYQPMRPTTRPIKESNVLDHVAVRVVKRCCCVTALVVFLILALMMMTTTTTMVVAATGGSAISQRARNSIGVRLFPVWPVCEST
jgi:hypothetical protein